MKTIRCCGLRDLTHDQIKSFRCTVSTKRPCPPKNAFSQPQQARRSYCPPIKPAAVNQPKKQPHENNGKKFLQDTCEDSNFGAEKPRSASQCNCYDCTVEKRKSEAIADNLTSQRLSQLKSKCLQNMQGQSQPGETRQLCHRLEQLRKCSNDLEDMLDLCRTLTKIMVLCKVPENKASLLQDSIICAFINYDEFPDGCRCVKKMRKNEFFSACKRDGALTRFEGLTAYSIVKYAFKAYYANHDPNCDSNQLSDCQFKKAARKTLAAYVCQTNAPGDIDKVAKQVTCEYDMFLRRSRSRRGRVCDEMNQIKSKTDAAQRFFDSCEGLLNICDVPTGDGEEAFDDPCKFFGDQQRGSSQKRLSHQPNQQDSQFGLDKPNNQENTGPERGSGLTKENRNSGQDRRKDSSMKKETKLDDKENKNDNEDDKDVDNGNDDDKDTENDKDKDKDKNKDELKNDDKDKKKDDEKDKKKDEEKEKIEDKEKVCTVGKNFTITLKLYDEGKNLQLSVQGFRMDLSEFKNLKLINNGDDPMEYMCKLQN